VSSVADDRAALTRPVAGSAVSARIPTRIVAWLQRNWLGLVSGAVLLVLWEVVAWAVNYPYLPPPSTVVVALQGMLADGTIATAVQTSLTALAIGISIAIVAGITVGALMGLSTTVRLALNVYIDALMASPMTAFVPVFILLFGLGIETRVIVVTLFAFFPIVVNTQAGMLAADPDLIMMARSFGAGRLKTFFKVRLPMSYGHIQAGLRMGMARGVDGNVTGEVLIAAVGLGGLVTQYGRAFTSDRLFAVVVVIVTLSFLAVGLTRLLGRLILGVRS
jgi:NitT/TauT family transport system permease protein